MDPMAQRHNTLDQDMSQTETSAVLVGPRRIEMQEFPVPQAGEDDGVLEVEVAGVCGSDVFHYNGSNAPVILGHEIVGRISDIGPVAQNAWGVGTGDRVVVEATFGCGRCERCRMGMYRMCNVSKGYGGAVKSDQAPYLWGGYGQFVYLPPTARVHRISEELPGDVAVLVCAVLGNGVRWMRTIGGVTIGDTAVVVGPGPQGLAATVAARESGAKEIVMVGLSRDEARLAMARRLGATHVIAADRDDPRTVVAELTDGAMANVVIDVTNTADSPPLALDLVGMAGTMVLGGGAGQRPSPLMTDRITAEEITIRGVNTHDSPAVKQALSIAESGRYPLEEVVSHRFAVDEAERAIQTVAGEVPNDGLIKVVMYPDS